MKVQDIVEAIGNSIAEEIDRDAYYNTQYGYTFSSICIDRPAMITLAAICDIGIKYLYQINETHIARIWKYVSKHNSFCNSVAVKAYKCSIFEMMVFNDAKKRVLDTLLRDLLNESYKDYTMHTLNSGVNIHPMDAKLFEEFSVQLDTKGVRTLFSSTTPAGLAINNEIDRIVECRIPKMFVAAVPMLYILSYIYNIGIESDCLPPTIPLSPSTYNWELGTIQMIPRMYATNKYHSIYFNMKDTSITVEPFNLWSFV